MGGAGAFARLELRVRALWLPKVRYGAHFMAALSQDLSAPDPMLRCGVGGSWGALGEDPGVLLWHLE